MSEEIKKVIEITYKQLEIKCRKSLVEHLLIQNTYDSNLITDISTIDYTKDNLGKMELTAIEDIPELICDDLYIYTYLSKEDVVYVGNKIKTTSGANGSGPELVNRIYGIISKTLTKNLPEISKPHTQVTDTINLEYDRKEGLTRRVVKEIDDKLKIYEKWEKYTLKKAVGLVLLKIDVSAIPIIELEKNFPEFRNRLNTTGCSVYAIDYTKDYCGTLIRDNLERHLVNNHNYFIQDVGDSYFSENSIIDNKKSVGNNVFSFINYDKEGKINRVKLYNKFVANMESGTVRSKFGCHLSECIDNDNPYLDTLFNNKQVRDNGITRIEVSVYGVFNFSIRSGLEKINKNLSFFSGNSLFVKQPTTRQWKNLQENIDRCFIIGDIPEKTIFVAFYGNSITKRVAGLRLECGNFSPDKWDKALEWIIGDYGFKNDPVFVSNILSSDKETIQLSPLKCYYKKDDTHTYLAPTNKPKKFFNENHKNIEDFLPSNNVVSWIRRTKKLQNIANRKSDFDIYEDDTLLQDKVIYTYSTKQRNNILEDLEYAKWISTLKIQIEEHIKEVSEKRKQEIEKLRYSIKCRTIREEESRKRREIVFDKLTERGYTKLLELENTEWNFIGFRKLTSEKTIIVLENPLNKELTTCFAQPKLKNKIEEIKKIFSSTYDKFQRETYWFYPDILEEMDEIKLKFLQKKSFINNKGEEIQWLPSVLDNPSLNLNYEIMEEKSVLEERLKNKEKINYLSEIKDINKKEAVSSYNMEEGIYIVTNYHKTQCRGKEKTYVLLIPCMEDYSPKSTTPIISFGYFIDEELKKINDLSKVKHPLYLILGNNYTTPTKKQHRKAKLAYNKED